MINNILNILAQYIYKYHISERKIERQNKSKSVEGVV